MSFVEFLILTLAVFRLARLVIEDTITERVRTALLSQWPGEDVKYDAGDKVRGGTVRVDGDLYAAEPTAVGNKVAKLLSCYWCTSFWVALALTVAWYLWPQATFWVALPFALSAGAAIFGVLMHEAVE